jgi:signal transduction histidine kinase
MPERGAEEIRQELAAARQLLADDLDALRAEARSLVPVALAGLVAIGLLSRRKVLRTGVKLLWKLR